jgi:hypothetical protein
VQKVEGRTKKNSKKRDRLTLSRRRPAAGNRWSLAGCGLTLGQGSPGPFLGIFKFFFKFLPILWSIFYWKFGEWARAFGRMGAEYTHFFKLPSTLGSIKSSIPHRVWRFYFF